MFSLVRLKMPNSEVHVLHVAVAAFDPAWLLCDGRTLTGETPVAVGLFAGDKYCHECFKEALVGAERLSAILTLLRSVVLQ